MGEPPTVPFKGKEVERKFTASVCSIINRISLSLDNQISVRSTLATQYASVAPGTPRIRQTKKHKHTKENF